MVIVTETKIDNQTGFHQLDTKTGELTKISYTSHKVHLNGKDYVLIYNKRMEINLKIFEFLNFHLSNKSQNTVYKAAQALKLLFVYEEIFNKKITEFKQKDINNFKVFLHGYDLSGNEISFKFTSKRSNSTINSYLSICRQLLNFLGVKNSVIFRRIGTYSYLNTKESSFNEKYYSNEKTANIKETPMYISIEEFKKIINLIRAEYSIRDEIIVRLMFQCGLRIGEVFGLTFEDLEIIEDEGAYIPIAYIRNRYTDQSFQLAKSCMNIVDRSQYKQREYKSRNIGYQNFVVPIDLYDSINEYINEYHHDAEIKHENYYFEKNKADIVDNNSQESDNFYVFINSLGKPLSQAVWNKRLREIFKKLEINLDIGGRNHNLNHRFRHGFAMFNVQYLKCNELELMNRMRHSTINSIISYFNPTLKDQIKIKTEFLDSIYDEFPELDIGG